MKIYGIFRGFPGLGRVMSGVSILSLLKRRGHTVKAYSYMQGLVPIERNGFAMIISDPVEEREITAIGLNPVGMIGEKLIETICRDDPDLVIVDGEPLLISTLALVYPRKKILALLNPADIFNPSQTKSSADFFCIHYLSAGTAVVHGLNKDEIIIPTNRRGCNIFTTNTILRQEVLDTNVDKPTRIVAILGGGCNNASKGFLRSTIEMGKRILNAAKLIPQENFTLYCNDKKVAEELENDFHLTNITIVGSYTSPKEMYRNAKVVICRAGRNTISEILYLNLPAILMSTNGDFRSIEQEKNIDQVCNLKPGQLIKSNNDDPVSVLADKIRTVIGTEFNGDLFQVGNERVLELIDSILLP